MWHKISLKGVIIRAVTDVVGSNIWGFGAGIYISWKYQLYSMPVAEQMTRMETLVVQDPVVATLNLLIGGGFTVLGGYIAARIAKHDELLNGTLASFLCVLFALLAIESTSILWVIVSVVVNPILALLGGYLRAWQTRKQNIPAQSN